MPIRLLKLVQPRQPCLQFHILGCDMVVIWLCILSRIIMLYVLYACVL